MSPKLQRLNFLACSFFTICVLLVVVVTMTSEGAVEKASKDKDIVKVKHKQNPHHEFDPETTSAYYEKNGEQKLVEKRSGSKSSSSSSAAPPFHPPATSSSSSQSDDLVSIHCVSCGRKMAVDTRKQQSGYCTAPQCKLDQDSQEWPQAYLVKVEYKHCGTFFFRNPDSLANGLCPKCRKN